MKNSNFNSIYDGMWERLKALNGKTIELITKKFSSNINSGRPIVFTIEGIFSGDKTDFYYSGDEANSETIAIVKLRMTDLKNLEASAGGTNKMKAPIANLKSFIENVRVDGVNYKIESEKLNGFGTLMILKVCKK